MKDNFKSVLVDTGILLILHEQILHELINADISYDSVGYLREELSGEVTELIDLKESVKREKETYEASEYAEELEQYEKYCCELLQRAKEKFEQMAEFLSDKMERLDQLVESL